MAEKKVFLDKFFPYLVQQVGKSLSLDASGEINYEADFSVHLVSLCYVFYRAFVHSVYIFLGLSFAIFPFVFAHIITLCICMICFFLVKTHKYAAASALFFIDAELSTSIGVYCFGLENYIFLTLVLLIIMQIIVAASPAVMRVAIVTISLLTMIALIFYGANFGHLVKNDDLSFVLMCFSLAVGTTGILITLLFGNTLKVLLEQIKAKQITMLEKHAYTDTLTGLHNRRYSEHFFNTLVEKQLNSFFEEDDENEQMCVAMIDIDNFKRVNDTYGHAMGDHVLVDLAQTLSKSLRYNDTIIRYGGEEFLIVLNKVDLLAAEKILEKLRLSVANHTVSLENIKMAYTITIGVALLRISDVQKSIEACDKKLYEGKTSGKNKVVI